MNEVITIDSRHLAAKRKTFVPVEFRKRNDAAVSKGIDTVVSEMPITIYVNGHEVATVICSPWSIRELTVGFLYSEGILPDIADLEELEDMIPYGSSGKVFTKIRGFSADLMAKTFMKRHITSCCGRGRTSFYYEADARLCKESCSQHRLTPDTVFSLSEELQARSGLFRDTGGVHNAALAKDGQILVFHDDVGRHNTLDKILGYCLLEDICTEDKIIVFSGRISSEVIVKISKMGCPIVISRAAPTELALTMAEDLGITVIGFAKGGKFNLYTHTERII